ncbi:hypothetical protein UMM65_07090 [Aureibaculum sp. 2210JD6-5]|uniref:hypothetical protein n=1 Tax=Aureibaculum sp. 2210JD6-5 TaxID=3103957 RepID=UPI002AAD18BC|nr:hypothetical protein [Aureibaculum sp. 2210JD6-5]MDY7395001.1 hypothetical protein [Aureibaculum sp. 2210JD6-5]
MNLIKKIIPIVLVLIAGSLVFLQYKFKSEITNAIDKKLPQNIKIDYTQLNANVFSGTVAFDSLSAKILNDNKNVITSLNANSLNISGFSVWQFLVNNTISINNIIFENPDLLYYSNQQSKERPKDSTKNERFDKSIKIDKISFKNGSFKIKESKEDSLYFNMDSISFNLIGLSTDAYKLKEKIPFDYRDYNFSCEQIFMNMNQFEHLKIEKLNVGKGKLKLQNLYIKPKFTPQELSTKIVVERDHIQLHIPELAFDGLYFGFNNSRFYLLTKSGTLTKPELIMYRDKRIADDMTIKKLYSKMLRELSFKLDISEFKIGQGYISYSERVKNDSKAGKIFFNDVNASIINLSNTYEDGEKTEISASSNFMGKAPMTLDLSFDVNNNQDEFLASGQFKNFDVKMANSFFESNLNAKAEGEIEQIFFTFNGNNFSSKGDLKMKYRNFKFKVLNKKNRVNKLLTAIGNIFVKDGSKADKDGFRHGNIEVERNKNKSFFNYLWINVEDGLISTLTGDGEKN